MVNERKSFDRSLVQVSSQGDGVVVIVVAEHGDDSDEIRY